MQVPSLESVKDPLEKEVETHSSILAWEIQEELGRLSSRVRKESDMTEQRDEGLKIPNSGPSLNWGWSSGQS